MTTIYKVNEIFYSLQGEGARVGTPNVFVRFANCNLTCSYCDTEFTSYTEMTAHQIVQRVYDLMAHDPRSVIFTGGEPLLQLNDELLKEFTIKDYLAVETNGSMKVPRRIDWVCVSPKVAEHVLEQNFPTGVHELKYVRHKGQGIPQPMVKAQHYSISPQFKGDQLDKEDLEYCINLVKENPRWKLSIQMHKLLKVR